MERSRPFLEIGNNVSRCLRELVVSTTVKNTSKPTLANTSQLFEKERDASDETLISDAAHPFRI
jgi:hypothetical protein